MGLGLGFNISRPYSVTCLHWIPIFELHVVRCGSKNGHQKDLCLDEIGLCAQKMVTILGLVVNINQDANMIV